MRVLVAGLAMAALCAAGPSLATGKRHARTHAGGHVGAPLVHGPRFHPAVPLGYGFGYSYGTPAVVPTQPYRPHYPAYQHVPRTYVVPQYVVPRYVVPQYVVPQYVVPQYVVPQHAAPQYVVPAPSAPPAQPSAYDYRYESGRAQDGGVPTIESDGYVAPSW